MKTIQQMLFALTVVLGGAWAAAGQYTVVELPNLGGASLAQRINDRGQIVGEAFLANGPPHAALWFRGTITDLGTLGGATSIANDINNKGQITGFSRIATGATRSFLWENGSMINIGTLGGAMFAFGINQKTEIVGFGRTGGGTTPWQAFIWRRGAFTTLGTLGGRHSYAYDINDQGCVVGESEIDPNAPGLTHAFVWCDGVMTDLGTLGGPFSAANAINENGTIVGISITDAFEIRAFAYDDGVMIDLGQASGAMFSGATGINARGQIVGISSTQPDNSSGRSPVLWEGLLPILLPTLGGDDNFANDVNASGTVVGMSSDGLGRRHAVTWQR